MSMSSGWLMAKATTRAKESAGSARMGVAEDRGPWQTLGGAASARLTGRRFGGMGTPPGSR